MDGPVASTARLLDRANSGTCTRWGPAPRFDDGRDYRNAGQAVNWLTLLLLAILGLMTFRAYRNGFVRELVSLASVIVAVAVAGVFYDDLYPKIDPIVDNVVIAALIAFLSLFGAVIVAGQVAAFLLKQSVQMLNLGGADQLAGGAFGLLKGVLICQVILVALVVFPDPDLRQDIDDSAVARPMVNGAPVVLALLPGGFADRVEDFLRGRYVIGETESAASR